MRGSWGLVLLTVLLIGCGRPDVEVENPEDFWTPDAKSEMISRISSQFKDGDKRYVVHIHFMGHDWGAYRNLETKVDLHEPPRDFPFSLTALPEDAAALKIVTEFSDRSVLLSLAYRYFSSRRALRAFETLFQCENGKSELLDQTLVIGSGGSHGVDELNYFGHSLKKLCGKAIDFALVSEAIAQPGPFPLGTFDALNSGGYCLQFYQRTLGNIVMGAPLENCTNVKVRNAHHFGSKGLARYAEAWTHMLLDDLDLSLSDFNLGAVFEKIPYLREDAL